MKKAVRLLLVLFLVLSLNGCDEWDDWFGDDDDDDTTVTTTDTTTDTTTVTDTTADDTTDDTTESSGTEYATYFGLTNGGMPTFYFSKNMSEYPTSFTLVIDGCLTAEVDNNGHRWTGGGWILKQSEVFGRGMGLIGSDCSPGAAHISW